MADFISREAAKAKKIYSVERRELVVPVAEIDWIPPADVVARDCYDRILAENDTMREMLARIGKKCGDSMDDVRPVVMGVWKTGHCTVCGIDVASRLDTWTNIQKFQFCPFCGADMSLT